MKTYISGPMRGIDKFNYPLFNRVAADLRGLGYEVWNPAENFGGGTDYTFREYMREDLINVLHVDSIVLLRGWEKSVGACIEVDLALALELPFSLACERGDVITYWPLTEHDIRKSRRQEPCDKNVEAPRIKDSGERLTFESGMQRDVTTGKIKWHLVTSGPMLKRWAEHLTAGAEKYSEDNWLKADGEEERKRFKESAYRHFMQWYYGDEDEDHASATFFNVNGTEYVKGKLNGSTTV